MKPRIPWWLWLALVVPLAVGLARLRFDVEVLNLLPGRLPAVQGLRLYQEYFVNAGQLILTVRARDAADASAAARALAAALAGQREWVAEARWQPPWQEQSADAGELLASLWLNQSPDVFQQLTQRLAESAVRQSLAEAREALATSLSPETLARTARDPLRLGSLPGGRATLPAGLEPGADGFASADGSFRLMAVEAATPLAGYQDCIDWLGRVQAVVDATRAAPGFPAGTEIGYTGRPAFVAEIAAGMEADFAGPSLLTLGVIAGLFYLAHRRWRPLLWLVVLLGVVLAATLALGGLLYGRLNVVSLGFASILLGLAEDFGIVLYQEARSHPELDAAGVRRLARPGIVWSAVTTAGAFLLLNLSALPGLGQLGTLVAVGVLLAAAVMLVAYLPPLGRFVPAPASGRPRPPPRSPVSAGSPWPVTGCTLLLLLPLLLWVFLAPPVLDPSPESLRPRHSLAHATLAAVKQELRGWEDAWWLVVPGRSEQEVADKLAAVQPELAGAMGRGWLRDVTLPSGLWPDPRHQARNRLLLPAVLERRDALRLAREAGFTGEALALAEGMFDAWTRAAATPGTFWPTNGLSRWVLNRFAARPAPAGGGETPHVALVLLYPGAKAGHTVELAARLHQVGGWLTGWNVLGGEVFDLVRRELLRVLVPMAALLLLSLWLAFRAWRDVILSAASLGVSGLLLHAVMGLAGWSWNLMNLMALPLLLGVGVDFSIHMLLALRRLGGDVSRVRRSVGRALLLAGSTTTAGFAALSLASNGGIASLGRVCAAGVACALVTAVGLLPAWWLAWGRRDGAPELRGPSSFYRAGSWRLGLRLARWMPVPVLTGLTTAAAVVYRMTRGTRWRVVVANLAPVFPGDEPAARRAARDLFRNFARKLVDLWRYEAGHPVQPLLGHFSGGEHLEAARARGRGVLLVTVHLGNWELGAPLLDGRGIPLQVITQAEPDPALTVLREAARARRGVATLPLGSDPFAAVEVIRRLEANHAVALLLDRPPPATAVPVQLFGRPFAASVAAAELARASGCAIVPVTVLRSGRGYEVCALPEIAYERAALRAPAARQALTQRLVDAFAPVIAKHASQWYHFVPVWPEPGRAPGEPAPV